MKNRLLITFCIAILILSYTNVKVYATPIEQPVAGITTILDKVNQTEIKKLLDINYGYTTNVVNLRKEASTNSDIVAQIGKREKIQTISSSNGWSKIKYKDNEGYIKSEYLRDTELPSLNFTTEEIDLIAKVVWLESRGESDFGSSCVVRVIINRLLMVEFSDTIFEVLSDKNEFSTWKLLDTANPTEREYEIIEETLMNLDDVLDNEYVYFSTSPMTKNGLIKIGNHYFSKIEK